MTGDTTDTTCDHYGAQVAIEVQDVSEKDVPCSWCGADAELALRKSRRHAIAFCGECRTLIGMLARGGGGGPE